MKTETKFLIAGMVAIAGYLLYQRYRDAQRASAHPLIAPNPANFLQPVTIEPALIKPVSVS